MKKTMIVMTLMMVSALMFALTVDGYVTDADNGAVLVPQTYVTTIIL